MVPTPNHWTREDFNGVNHPYNRIGWMLLSESSTIESMTSEQQDLIHNLVAELKDIEDSAILELSSRKAKRRAKILKARPLKESDDEFKTAFHAAMAMRQITTDEMDYDLFKTIHDEMKNILDSRDE